VSVRQAHAEEATVLDHCHERDESTGVGWLLFAMVMFAIMTFAVSIAYIGAHVWLIGLIALRSSKGQWFRALAWTCVLVVLIYIDVQMLS
jgi:hypothetical protein